MLIVSLIPLVGGLLLATIGLKKDRSRTAVSMGIAALTSVLALCLLTAESRTLTVISYTETFTLEFCLDAHGKFFLALMAFLWPLAVLYASEYMEHEERPNSFFGFYLMTYGVMILFCCAGNIFTMYVLFECITLVTLPLVWHKKDDASIRAARSYIRYSIGCAAFAFTAMILLAYYGGEISGGGFDFENIPQWILHGAFLAAFFGFGFKAAVFPICAWLPKASAAPTPVTALLHAVAVVNSGVFAIQRLIYDVFGMERLRGSLTQSVVLTASLVTVLFGACMAVREVNVKRKLAYSTIGNLGYMLFGASLMTTGGLLGSMAHMVTHGLMKILLFFCIGIVMVKTDRVNERQMRGLAGKMPITFGFFVFGAVALIGIPPLCGFISKYLLIEAALDFGGLWALAGPVVLLTSSVLTGIYALSTLLPAFFMPFEASDGKPLADSCDPGWRMLLPLSIIALACLVAGIGSASLLKILVGAVC